MSHCTPTVVYIYTYITVHISQKTTYCNSYLCAIAIYVPATNTPIYATYVIHLMYISGEYTNVYITHELTDILPSKMWEEILYTNDSDKDSDAGCRQLSLIE